MCALMVGAWAVGLAAPALSQVLEISDNGSVQSYDGPAIYTDAGVRPIAPRVSPGAAPADVARLLAEAAAHHNLPPPVLEALAWRESKFDNRATSSRGAVGVMQLMPQTARDLGVDPYDLRANIEGGAAYLSRQIGRFGDLSLALAAYNAGPEAVMRYGGVPPFAETQGYVRSILARVASAPRSE